MKKPFFTLGALVGAAGVVILVLASMGAGNIFSLGLLLLVAGLIMLLIGFFRGESKS